MDTSTAVNSSLTLLPPSLGRLSEVAHNLWWSWTLEARELFETIDPTLWFLSEAGPAGPAGRRSVISPSLLGSAPTLRRVLRKQEKLVRHPPHRFDKDDHRLLLRRIRPAYIRPYL
ncbi:MAG: DUF3417 domain-containing protein [Nitrospira sp.]|nr:DUF3417 domain-containing protein [Nitrospira sp.]